MHLARVLALTALLLLVVPPLATGVAPTFRMNDTGTTGVELNLGVAPNGHIFVGGWNYIAKSIDDGVTWTRASNDVVTVAADRTLRVDHVTGRVYADDTYLGCTILASTGDEGATWVKQPLACGLSATDHEKIAVGPKAGPLAADTMALGPSAVYVCANGLVDDACGVSLDGGLTMIPLPPHGVGCAFQGQPAVSSQGVLYEATGACGAQVRFSKDGGLSWTARAVPVAIDSGTANEPVVGTTPDGTLYVAYMTPSFLPMYTWTKDDGLTWSTPVALAPSGVVSTAFPVVIGGDDGRVAFAFYGSSSVVSWNHNPGSAPATVPWDGYVVIVTDADTGAPVVQPTKVTTDPLHYGCVSKQGGCGGAVIADYMDVDVGPDGRVYAVFMDACPTTCTSAAQSTTARGVVAVQTGGDDLRP